MLSRRAVGLGMALCAGPACLGKLIGSLSAGRRDVWFVGAAMLGRGEFGFLVAETARARLLNPAPVSFGQLAPSGGGWCVYGNCGDGKQGVAGDSSPYGKWCTHCDADGECDAVPRVGERYWQLGKECDKWQQECDCVSMMDAESFAIAMWAVVGSSLLSPFFFRLALRQRAHSEALAVAAAAAAASGGSTTVVRRWKTPTLSRSSSVGSEMMMI
ncbi:hypothetical protein T492DRAFT_835697 [Pavlovales sp. CCMP2436]|nr:hypothetical protein T492DRAFT_835697 [Pavlovales sp. CCMP2436]